jgi:hypothetical protein
MSNLEKDWMSHEEEHSGVVVVVEICRLKHFRSLQTAARQYLSSQHQNVSIP